MKALQERTNEEGPSLKIRKPSNLLFSGIQAALKKKIWIEFLGGGKLFSAIGIIKNRQ